MNNEFDTNRHSGPGVGGMHAPSAQGTHVQSADGTHDRGADGMHTQGEQVIQWQDLTLKQQRVLEWLARFLKGTEKEITCLYRRMGNVLNMSQRAVRVHIAALKAKGLILTTVVYRSNSRQKIGLRVSITPEAPIKHLPHKLSEAELQEMKERARKEAQVWALINQGYTYVKEIDGYIREPQHLIR